MKKLKKSLLIFLIIVLCLAWVCFSCVYFLFLYHYNGHLINFEWTVTDEFKIENIKTVQKEKNKPFVILNFADIQMCDLEDIFHFGTIKNELKYLIEKTKPNLITLTGDQTWSNENLISLKSLISWLDSFKIPYAPIFGNHDFGNEKDSAVAGINYCCDLYEKGKYSLFNRGPSNLGSLGNYVINIVEDDKLFYTLYMMDSGYENTISNNQIEWFKWNAEGIKMANENNYSNGMIFLHKPLPAYAEAYYNYKIGDKSVEAIGNVNVHYSLYGSDGNDLYNEAKIRKITDIVCGHQHGNSFTLKYDRVRLTFALKTGELGGYYDDGISNLNGATYFSLDTEVSVKTIMVESNHFHISGTKNVYLN